MPLQEPDILNRAQLTKIIGKSRSDFRTVKYRLDEWHTYSARWDQKKKRDELTFLAGTCLALLEDRNRKNLKQKHDEGLRRVLSDVFHYLAYLDYESNKAAGASSTAKGLSAAYGHERTDFEQSDKAGNCHIPEGNMAVS